MQRNVLVCLVQGPFFYYTGTTWLLQEQEKRTAGSRTAVDPGSQSSGLSLFPLLDPESDVCRRKGLVPPARAESRTDALL